MKIKANQDIQAFISRCLNNLANERKNDFVGLKINKKNHAQIQRQMYKANFKEFSDDPNTWPNLFINTDDFKNSYYHKTINLKQVKYKDFAFDHIMISKGILFNADDIIFDDKRELNDWMKLRALDQDYNAIVLYQNNDIWMIDAPSEANTIDPKAKKAHGNVLTFGLGIGYFALLTSLNDNVNSLTIVERSQAVIEMFKNCILPQFPNQSKIKIINDDAFNLFNQEYLSQFDYVFVDIWQSNNDGLVIIEKLLKQYNPPLDKVDFWIENSCLEVMPTLILLYFKKLLYPSYSHPLMKRYRKQYQMINQYLTCLDIIVTDVETLKYYMYDKKIIREILAYKKSR